MRTSLQAVATFAALVSSAEIVPIKRQAAVNPYTPTTTSCPAGGSLIRAANSLSSEEQAYIAQREPKAADALSTWLKQALPGVSIEQMPKLALALSGGGTKAGLTTAGAVYGLDNRESTNSSVAGLLQSMTYVSALSGGSLTLAGIMANNFAKVSTLRSDLLDASYLNVFAAAVEKLPEIRASVGNKTAAGYTTTLIDVYGRLLSYNFISATGDPGSHWSDVTSQSSFQDHEAPYPIITITQTNVGNGMCEPNLNSAIWEVSPSDFGSFDARVKAFYPTQYMGTKGNGNSSQCVTGFDNTGFIIGMSSNILIPDDDKCTTGNFTFAQLNNTLAQTTDTAISGMGVSLVNPYGIVPNPFYQAAGAGEIRTQQLIYATDGGFSGQVIPMFPWLQPERAIDVIFAVDTQTQPPNNITNGTSMYDTYMSAQQKGLVRMPAVPTPEEFVQKNYSSSAQFYGCHDPEAATVIYLPNTELGDVPDGFSFTAALLNTTFNGGVAMVTQSQSNNSDWAACVACAIIHKNVTQLPDVCTSCLARYCWPSETTTNGSSTTPSSSSSPSQPTSYTGAASAVRSTGLMLCAGAILAFFL